MCVYPFDYCSYAVFIGNHHEEVQLYLYMPWRFSGGGGTAPLILNLNTGRARVVTFPPCLFTPGEIFTRHPLCISYSAPIVCDVGWASEPVWTFQSWEDLLLLPDTNSACSPVTV